MCPMSTLEVLRLITYRGSGRPLISGVILISQPPRLREALGPSASRAPPWGRGQNKKIRIRIFAFRISEMRNFYNGISPNSGNAEFL